MRPRYLAELRKQKPATNMAMLNFNPPRFIAQPVPSNRKTLIPALTIDSVSNRLVSPPRRLSLASQRRRNLHVPNSVKSRRQLEKLVEVRELIRGDEDDVEEVDSDYDEEEEEEDDDEIEEEGRDGDEDDVFVLGLGSRMQKWFENKPTGFGEGKVYDTSIEDKLLEEMQQSRIAQAANINRLKHSRGNGGDNVAGKKAKKNKNEVQVEEDKDEVVPTGVQVRLGNLPKKKNIHRDLNLAFKGFAGVSTIMPAVTGNKKTRDPVCLGFAHVYLEKEQDAHRFVRTFSGQTLTFGRVQKQIKCEMMDPRTQISADEIMDKNPEVVSQLALPVVDEYPPYLSIPSEDGDFFEAEFQPIGENSEYFVVSDSEDAEVDASSMAHLLPSASNRQKKAAMAMKPRAKARPNNKVPAAKAKSGKGPRLEFPGSAKRLKIKEKAVLTGVLSKYQAMAASVTSDS